MSMQRLEDLNYSKRMDKYTDSLGLIGNIESWGIDGADSLQRFGMVGISNALHVGASDYTWEFDKREWLEKLALYRRGMGLYVRHPDHTQWYSKLTTTSNDQIRSIAVALALFKEYWLVWDICWALIKRGGFYWNTRQSGPEPAKDGQWKVPDWSGPEHWAMLIRGLWPWFRWTVGLPIILLGDAVGFFANLISTFLYPYEGIENCVQLNQMCMLILATEIMPTPISFLNLWIWKTYRPVYRMYYDPEYNKPYWRPWEPIFDIPFHQYKNPGLYVLHGYFWEAKRPPIPLIWRAVAIRYFQR